MRRFYDCEVKRTLIYRLFGIRNFSSGHVLSQTKLSISGSICAFAGTSDWSLYLVGSGEDVRGGLLNHALFEVTLYVCGMCSGLKKNNH